MLTWNAPDACARTVAAVCQHVVPVPPILVVDHGSDVPLTLEHVRVIREPVNRGAGQGLGAVMRHLLATDAEAFIFLEDDWTCEAPLDVSDLEDWVADPTLAQVRLGRRALPLTEKYLTYGLSGKDCATSVAQMSAPLLEAAGGYAQRLRILWSSNPFACHRTFAERWLVQGWDELTLGRRIWPQGHHTISCTPGWFRHEGVVKARRTRGGWTK